ncbi:MAG: head decoration protein [Smithella sp.]
MTTYTEGNYLGDLLKFELERNQSREQVTVLAGQSLVMGEVVGKITKSTPTTGTADAGNTGAGTCTGVTAGALAQVGIYALEVVTAPSTSTGLGGEVQVLAPDGSILPPAEIGSAYTNGQINFTVNDSGADFIVGDKFTIAVSAGSGSVVALDLTAVNGAQDAYGIMTDTFGAAADVQGVAIVRDAQIEASYLTWPAGFTTDQKNAALAVLALKGIVQRYDA